MKNIVFSSIIVLFSIQANAQLRLAVKGGYNNASATYPDRDGMIKQSISAFQVGILGELEIKKVLLRSNILFNQKGNYSDNSRTIIDAGRQVTYRLNYIEVNILAGYKFILGKHAGISIGTGPYIGLGLSGTEKGTSSSFNLPGTYKIDRKIKFFDSKTAGDNYTYFKSIDYGIDLNASVNYKKCFLYLNLGKGLANRVSSNSPDWNSRNNVFSVGLGYYFK